MSITDPPHPPRPQHTVTAIVVSHDGSRWLGETLEALLRQTRPVDRVVGVDNGSRDGSAALLTGALGSRAVLTLPRSTGFGEAVAEVLDRLGPGGGREWIWLLHDDCAPDVHALRLLLEAADEDPKAAVLGPKLRDWLDRRLLLEVGVTVDRTGRRDTGLEAREFDQGQYDGTRDVLSVSTAGMLIRRDVWEEVGGLDPALPLFRDDLDLCWRVRTAGYRVQNVTRAIAWHAEAATRRRRRITASGDHPRRLDRRNALFVVMANLPARPLLWALVRNAFGSLFRTVLFLVAKQPANALDEFLAFGSVFGHPIRMIKARRVRAKGRRQGYAAVSRLLTPPGAGYRRLVDRAQSYLAGGGFVESAGRHHAMAASPHAQEDGEELLTDAGVMQRFFGNPGVLLFLALTVVTLVAERAVTGGARLGGGALVPVIGGASDLWNLYRESYHQVGLGTDAWAPPYVAVLAVLSTVLFGKTWLAVSLLLLGCVPLAGISAYAATRSMVPGRWTRVWLASSYALLPVATGAVAAGRLGTAVVFVLLPVYAALATTVLAGERRRARRAAWGLGLLLAVGTAFAPLVYPLTAILGALAALAFPRRGVAVSMLVAFAVPVVLLFPWLAQVVADPGQLLLEAGLHQPALVDPGLPAGSLLLLSPGGPGMPPLWVTGGLLAACLAALLMRRNRMVIAVGWGVALFGVLVAILVSRTTVTSINGDVEAPAWPGVPLAFAATGMLVVAALTADRVVEFRAAGGARRLAAFGVVLVAFSTPLLAAGMWIAKGVDGPLRGTVRDVVPALAAENSAGGERTLLLRASPGGLLFTVLRGRTPVIGEADIPVPDGPREQVRIAAAGLVSGRGGDDARVLAAHGVRFVVVTAPVGPEISHALDSQPSLARMSLSRSVGVWRLTQPIALPATPPGDPWHGRWLWAQAVLVLIVSVLAAPGSRTEPDEPAVPQDLPEPRRELAAR
ncbi:glycosyltransferase [Streptosporangium sp. OZ121]|uniref:glycosyltransferase family 2 protein n=1 Tax=Streptosporangium sp. OZ121 TaxID=3444183 RepID=UPI003F790A2D